MKYTYKENNLDFLRLVLSTSVVFLHLAFLAKTSLTSSLSESLHWLSGNAVSTFFIVSGFLIYMSYDKKKSLKNYLFGRFLRLYPAYALLIISCAFFLYFVSDISAVDYFFSSIKYLLYNLVFLNFLQPSIEGVFSSNPENIINGSLWTLKIEVAFYLMVPFLYILLERKYAAFYMTTIYALSFLYKELVPLLDGSIPMASTLSIQLPGQMMYFISGVFCFKYFKVIERFYKEFTFFSILVIYFEFDYLVPFSISILVSLVFISLPNLVSFKKFGDISYGVYIYHFPLIQVFIYYGVEFNTSFSIIFMFFILFAISYCSWVFIEKPSLGLKSRSI